MKQAKEERKEGEGQYRFAYRSWIGVFNRAKSLFFEESLTRTLRVSRICLFMGTDREFLEAWSESRTGTNLAPMISFGPVASEEEEEEEYDKLASRQSREESSSDMAGVDSVVS